MSVRRALRLASPLALLLILASPPFAGATDAASDTLYLVRSMKWRIAPIFDVGRHASWAWLLNIANALHVSTHPSTLDRIHLLVPGEPLTDDRLTETDRALREWGIVDVDSFEMGPPLLMADSSGRYSSTVRISVRDRWSTQGSASLALPASGPRVGASLRESNLFGTGIEASFGVSDNSSQWSTFVSGSVPYALPDWTTLRAEFRDASGLFRWSAGIDPSTLSYRAPWNVLVDVAYETGTRTILHEHTAIDTYQRESDRAWLALRLPRLPDAPIRWSAWTEARHLQTQGAVEQNAVALGLDALVFPPTFCRAYWVEQTGRTEDLPTGLWGHVATALVGGRLPSGPTPRGYAQFESVLSAGTDAGYGALTLSLAGYLDGARVAPVGVHVQTNSFVRLGEQSILAWTAHLDAAEGRWSDGHWRTFSSVGESDGLDGFPDASAFGATRWASTLCLHDYYASIGGLLVPGYELLLSAGGVPIREDLPEGGRFLGLSVGAGLRLAIERSTQGRAIHVDLYRRWSGGRMLAPGWAVTVSTDLVQRAYVTAAEPVPSLGLWP